MVESRAADERGAQLNFEFEGRTIVAEPGQSIAGALQRHGVRTISRGIKYHRPRGYTCGFGACGDCPVNVNGMPGVVSCTTPVRGGEQVRREGGLPGVGFDVLRTADTMRPFLKAGFQFHLFPRRPRLSALVGDVMARLAGGGRLPTRAAARRATVGAVRLQFPELLVIGGGLSGLTAALAAAEAGVQVTVIDARFDGGRSRVRTEPVHPEAALADHDGVRPVHLVDDALHRVRAHAGITLVRGTASGVIDGMVPVIDEHERTRYELRPRAVIVAAGSYESPVPVPGHDLPGVMLADAALRLAEVERVRPGRRAVVISDDPRAEQVAERLAAHGVTVREIVAADSLVRVTGWSHARGVVVRSAQDQHGRPGRARRIVADLVCVAAARRPAEELVLQFAYAEAGSHELVTSDGPEPVDILVVGSAAGSATYSLARIAQDVRTFLAAHQLPLPNHNAVN